MIKTTFRAHPVMIFTRMKPYLPVLILPLIRALVQYLTTRQIDGLLTLEVIALSFVVILAFLSYHAISITVCENRLILKKGVIFRHRAVIELSRLSSVVLRKNPLDYIFGSVECSVNTEAGRPKSSDFTFRMYQTDVKRLLKLLYGDSEREVIKFSPTKIALLAATTSSAFSGMIIGVPVVGQLSNLLGVAIAEVFLNEINGISLKMKSLLPPMANAVTLIVLAAYGVSFLTIMLKNVNFKLQSDGEITEVKSGMLIRRHIVFKKSKVNNICIEQTPLMHIFKRFSMRASIGGYANTKGEKAVIVPIATYKGLKAELESRFPNMKAGKSCIESPRTAATRFRFFLPPMVGALIIFAATAASAIFLEHFADVAFFTMAVLLGFDLYYATVCYRNYKYSRISFGDSLFASGMVGLNVRELYCPKNNIGMIKITRTPADRRYNTCKVKLVVRSENADSVRVKILDADTVCDAVKRSYDLKNITL